MPARHDEWDQVAESQLRASRKYQEKNIKQITVKLNTKTDLDIIRYLWSIDNKQGLIKRLLREEIEKEKK